VRVLSCLSPILCRFCVRRLYGKYWNLNSLLDQPEFVSDFYLSSLLGQFKLDGYDVFVVRRQIVNRKKMTAFY